MHMGQREKHDWLGALRLTNEKVMCVILLSKEIFTLVKQSSRHD